jgi:hypothetical protein
VSLPLISPEQARLRAAILELLERRGPGKTICPSDAARAVAAEDFRPLMDTARAAAAELVADGEIEVTQGGQVVDIAQARGPIRLRRRRGSSSEITQPQCGGGSRADAADQIGSVSPRRLEDVHRADEPVA